MSAELSLLEVRRRLVRRWWLLLLLGVLGGWLGWWLARTAAPVWEASAEIRVRLDEAQYAAERQTDVLTTMLREDTLGWVEAVFEQRAPAGALDARVQRFESRWLLTVWTRDPQSAVRLAERWAADALELSDRYLALAREARDLELQALAWEACLRGADGVQAFNRCAGTDFATLADVPAALDGLYARAAERREAARHFSPALQFELLGTGAARQVLFSSVWSGLAGTLLGLLAGFWLALWRGA